MTFDYKTVGGRIKHYRLSINKTQEELAKYYSVAQALGVTVDMLIDNSSDRASGNDYFFSNQLLPLVSSLSVEQRKMLIDFIELLKDYDVDKNNTKRG